MSEFKKYVRSGFDYRHVLMRPYVPGEPMGAIRFDWNDGVQVGVQPKRDTPKLGGMILTIEGEESVQWYVSEEDFKAQHTPEDASNANPKPGDAPAVTGGAVFGAQPVGKK